MAFLDRLNDLAKNLGDKTTEALETTKLNTKISTEHNAAQEDLKRIGDYYYNLFLNTGEAEEEVLEYCQSAKEHNEAAAAAQAEISRIRSEAEAQQAQHLQQVQQAQHLQQVQQAQQGQQAGTETVLISAGESGSGLTCQSCGKVNPPDTRFCCECGTKLVPPAPTRQSFCTNCGAPAAEGLKFCGECGTRLF